MALLLEQEIEIISMWGWLGNQGFDMRNDTNFGVSREYDFMEPEMARPMPLHASATAEEHLAHFAPYEEARRRARADWLIRRILTPNTPEGVLPANAVLALRRRLLTKVREQVRRRGPDGLMVRVTGTTLEGIDTIAEDCGIPTRTGVVTFLVREAMDTLTVKQRKGRR